MPLSHRPASLHDLALLALRVGLGVVMVAHGWQKWTGGGIGGTAEGFEGNGIPLATVAATFAIVVELVGGVAIIVGALTPLFAVGFAATMVGAMVFVHGGSGFYAATGGYEFVLLLGIVALVVAAAGPGRFSVDHLIGRGRRRDAVAA